MLEKNKPHIYDLPEVRFPMELYTEAPETDTYPRLSVSFPIFASKTDSGLTAFNEERIQNIHLKGALWAAVSLLKNTDFGAHKVNVYFHIEQEMMPICTPMLERCGVPPERIRSIKLPPTDEAPQIQSPQFGKKYMCLFDDEIHTSHWMIADTDAFFCSDGTIIGLYDLFASEFIKNKVATWQAFNQKMIPQSVYINWVYGAQFGVGCAYNLTSNPENELSLPELHALEQQAFDKVGLPFNAKEETYNLRYQSNTQFVIIPKNHKFSVFIKEHCINSYQDEFLAGMWACTYEEFVSLQTLTGIPIYNTESEYLNRDKSLPFYLAHMRPDNFDYEKGQTRYKEYFAEFFADLSRYVLSDIRITVAPSTVNTSPQNNATPSANDVPLRLHNLAPPYSVTNLEHTCPFTQKVRKACEMMTKLGHTIYHYGDEASDVVCTHHINVTNETIRKLSYPDPGWHKKELIYDIKDVAFLKFNENAVREIRKHHQPGDFVLAWGGWQHQALCSQLEDLPVTIVEPGIGYPDVFSKYHVFESSAWMHFIRGKAHAAHDLRETVKVKKLEIDINWFNSWHVQSYNEPDDNSTVIPNFFDPRQFEAKDESEIKDDYMLFLGRIGSGKGTDVAIRLAIDTGIPLIIAGQGDINTFGIEIPEHITFLGHADQELRRKLYLGAKVVVCPSRYIEPFLGVPVEAGLARTPMLVPHFGAPREYCIHGTNGYIFTNYEQLKWGLKNIDSISPDDCFRLAMRFSCDRISLMYHEYFTTLRRNLQHKQADGESLEYFYDYADRQHSDLTIDACHLDDVQIRIAEIQKQLGVV